MVETCNQGLKITGDMYTKSMQMTTKILHSIRQRLLCNEDEKPLGEPLTWNVNKHVEDLSKDQGQRNARKEDRGSSARVR